MIIIALVIYYLFFEFCTAFSDGTSVHCYVRWASLPLLPLLVLKIQMKLQSQVNITEHQRPLVDILQVPHSIVFTKMVTHGTIVEFMSVQLPHKIKLFCAFNFIV